MTSEIEEESTGRNPGTRSDTVIDDQTMEPNNQLLSIISEDEQ